MDKENVKIYLDYLDKEMTIMGILSTFSIVTLGFLAGKIVFTDTPSAKYNFWEQLHTTGAALGVLGIVFIIFSIKVVSVSKFRKKEK